VILLHGGDHVQHGRQHCADQRHDDRHLHKRRINVEILDHVRLGLGSCLVSRVGMPQLTAPTITVTWLRSG
jgi:hypothetical protein